MSDFWAALAEGEQWATDLSLEILNLCLWEEEEMEEQAVRNGFTEKEGAA